MNLRTYFTLHTIIFILVGLTVILMPTLMADMTGQLLTEPEGIQLSRLLGITLLSLSAITWFTRDMKPSKALSGIIFALALWHGLDALNMFLGVIQHNKEAIAWAFPFTHAIVSYGFIYFLLKSKKK